MQCSICFSDIKWYNKNTLYCGHVYHRNCIKKWLTKKDNCPYCRAIILKKPKKLKGKASLYVNARSRYR